jgi:diadenylate cyclase
VNELAALFQRLDWLSVVDIGLVAIVFFWLLYLVRGTQAVPLLRGVIILLVIIAILGNTLTLPAFGWLFQKAVPALLIAIPIVFQPELRRALERIGRAGAWLNPPSRHTQGIDHVISIIANACQRLTERRHGALIVLERGTGLQNYADTGVHIDSEVTSELLQTIFFRNTMLHDGAVIIRDNRILAAACILPLTTSYMSDRRMGLRHRAAIGITEATDAIAIVVSEEHGQISIAHNGRMIRRLDAQRLETVLRAFYQLDQQPAPPQWIQTLRRLLGLHDQAKPTRPASSASGSSAATSRRTADG